MGSVVFSDSYSTSIAGYKTFDVRVSFSESYNISTNQTTVTITGVELKMEGNGTNWGSLPFFGSIKVNGSTLLSMNGGSSVRVSLDGSGYCSVNIPSSGSVAITHNDDGSKSVSFALVGGVSYAGDDYFCAYYNGVPFGVEESSKTVALTTRPRASSISSCPSSVATEGTLSLSVSRNSSSFYHKATIKIGNTTMYTSGAFATSLSYTIPRAWFASYPTSTALSATLSVQTYTNAACTATVGSAVTRNISITADAGMKPSVCAGWASLAPYNTGVIAGITGYVKGYSKAQATFDTAKITCMNGAYLKTLSVTCQGSTDSSSPYLTPVLNAASVTVTCTVTDSRDRTASQSFTLTVMDYAAPALSGVEIFRCDGSGDPDEDGTSYSAKATVTYSPLNNQNSCSLSVAHMAAGGSYTTDGTLTSGIASYPLGTISADQSYTVRVTATDGLGNTAVYYVSIPTRKWAMKFRDDGNGVAFGKAAEYDNTFEVADDWEVKLGQPLPVTSGGTGAASASSARANLGIKIGARTAKTSSAFPFTATSDGILEVRIRINTQGRGYANFTSNGFIVDAYQGNGGYSTASFAIPKGTVVAAPSETYNLQGWDAFWTPLFS